MTVAFIVLAHDHEGLLRALLRELSPHPTVLHVDRHSEDLYASLSRSGERPEHVTLNSHPYCVHWGGFSALAAMMESLELALAKADNGTSHFVFLSGQCFPLRPIDEFIEYLTFCDLPVHCRGIPLDGTSEMGPSRVTRRHWLDGFIGHMKKVSNSRLPSVLRRLLYHSFAPFSVKVPDVQHVCGSQWTALPYDLAGELVEYYNSGGFDYLKNSFAPDEVAIPTYIYNSLWGSLTQHRGVELSSDHKISAFPNFHWLRPDMDGTITKEQLEQALCGEFFFVRKVPGSDYIHVVNAIKSTWN